MSKILDSVLFTLASVNDIQPTVTAARLGVNPSRKGQTFVRSFKIGGKKTAIKFRVNRLSDHSITLMATNYEGKLPKVGRPLTLVKV